MQSLVSIIIPTYNRAKYILETLGSISKQSYKNWECLIIDDGSKDATKEKIAELINEDARFQYYIRDANRLKGANSCRNMGLELASGEYILFFDSDDLMTPNHINVKLKAIRENDFDFVIAQTRFFNYEEGNTILIKQYNFKNKDISSYNYISHKINWLTYDTLIKSNLAKSISFNEKLSSGQEYNYFSKLVLRSTNAKFIKTVVTLRRHHDNSIRGQLRKNRIEQSKSYFHTYWNTYLDIKKYAPKKAKIFLVYRCYRILNKLPTNEKLLIKHFNKAILKEFGFKGFYYIFRLYIKRFV